MHSLTLNKSIKAIIGLPFSFGFRNNKGNDSITEYS